MESLCLELGLNVAHDYDGVETEEDVKTYQKAIIYEIRHLKHNQV